MKKQRVKKELRQMYEVERNILQALSQPYGTEEQIKYVCEKLFEVAEYIVKLKEYLAELRKNDD